VVIPVRNEERMLSGCLEALAAQDYAGDIEVLVVDGSSTDRTREVANAGGARVLDNVRCIQSCGLNLALAEAAGEVLVRVDARTRVGSDYVTRCIETLDRTQAALVGGAQVPLGETVDGMGIAAALASPLGGGPAAFRRPDVSRWADTVYLGALRVKLAREVGGWRDDRPTNEDADLAYRLRAHGGVWLDASIRSTYLCRDRLGDVARQYRSYGRGRARTMLEDPRSASLRQLAPLALLAGLVSPWRSRVALIYGSAIALALSGVGLRLPARSAAVAALAVPTMHLAWALGFCEGVIRVQGTTRSR